MADAVGKFGRLDVMVANAGVFQVWASPEDNSVEEWRRVLDTNLSGVMLSCLEAGRQMKRQGSGSIVATSSIVGHAGLKGNFSYTVRSTVSSESCETWPSSGPSTASG